MRLARRRSYSRRRKDLAPDSSAALEFGTASPDKSLIPASEGNNLGPGRFRLNRGPRGRRSNYPMFNAAKDAIAGRAAQTYLNNLIARYGTVQRLKLDSTKKQMEIVCLLEGEVTPITVQVGNYVVHSEGDRKFLEVSNCTCSRPWLQKVLADFAPGRRVELPAWAASAL